MEMVLLIAFVVNNIAWLIFILLNNRDNLRERSTLLVRIQRPEILYPQERQLDDKELLAMIQEEEDEIDTVGEVDPELPLRNENNG